MSDWASVEKKNVFFNCHRHTLHAKQSSEVQDFLVRELSPHSLLATTEIKTHKYLGFADAEFIRCCFQEMCVALQMIKL